MNTADNFTRMKKRKPIQERGEQRIREILDAAARIVANSAPLTIHNLSKEAGTSTGSLYHFFSDLSSVIIALSERHDENISKMVDALDTEFTKNEKVTESAGVFINRLFSPYATYLMEHPDYLQILKSRGFCFNKSPFQSLMNRMLHRRYPNWTTEKVKQESEFLHITATGILQQSFQRSKMLARECIPKILCVMELYLTHLEKISTDVF